MKNKLLVLLFLLSTLGYFTLKHLSKSYRNTNTVLGRISNLINKNNTIHLACEGISAKNVDIIWGYEFGEKIIIKNGKNINSIGHKYGKNTFTIKVKGLFQEKLFHYKSNNWHSHDYTIQLVQITPQKYKIIFTAIGPDTGNHITEISL